MTKCPECDQATENTASNARREVSLKIPEHHWMVFKYMFRRMNLKFGMEGLGEFANLLPAYEDQIPLEKDHLRYFDDVMIAYLFLALDRGYTVTTRTEPGGKPDYNGVVRIKVHADLTPPGGGEARSIQISDCAYEESAKSVCAYIEDAAARFAPL